MVITGTMILSVYNSREEALIQLITQKQQTGIYLTCLGVGMGNYKDSKLEALAKKGNGNFAYLDNVMEAEKVLVKELMQTLYVVVDRLRLEASLAVAAVAWLMAATVLVSIWVRVHT